MSFLDVLLNGYRRIQNNGVPLPPEPILDFVGATITDDPANTRTIVTVSACSVGGFGAVYPITSANGPVYTVPATSGSALVTVTALTGPITVQANASSLPDMIIEVVMQDQTFVAGCSLTLDGNGLNVWWRGQGASTQKFYGPNGPCNVQYDYGLSIQLANNGAAWVAS